MNLMILIPRHQGRRIKRKKGKKATQELLQNIHTINNNNNKIKIVYGYKNGHLFQ